MKRRLACALTAAGMAMLVAAPASAQQQAPPAQQPLSARDARTMADIRAEVDEIERRILMSGRRVTDPTLNDYIKTVGCKVAGERCSELRFYVLSSSDFNASMAPNGMMLINTGLLMRVENEAELAFVMAHEYGHYANGHTLDRINAMRATIRTGTFLALGVGVLGYVVPLMAMTAYARDQEREADMFASTFANANNYDSAAGVHAWENLRDEVNASTNRTTRNRFNRGSLFASHPLTAERIEYLGQVPRSAPDGGGDKVAYRNLIRPFLYQWLVAEIADRDAGQTLALLERLDRLGTDRGVLAYARGEVYRYRAQEGDDALALAAYTDASLQTDAPVQTWREIGVMQRKLGDKPAAAAAFRRYLELSPNAPDSQLISGIAATLEGDNNEDVSRVGDDSRAQCVRGDDRSARRAVFGKRHGHGAAACLDEHSAGHEPANERHHAHAPRPIAAARGYFEPLGGPVDPEGPPQCRRAEVSRRHVGD